jgi:hypothetical protein
VAASLFSHSLFNPSWQSAYHQLPLDSGSGVLTFI